MKKLFYVLGILSIMGCNSSVEVKTSTECSQEWEPSAVTDNTCGVCVRENCPNQLWICVGDPRCQAYNACQENPFPFVLEVACDNDLIGKDEWNEVVKCAHNNCCDICSDFIL